MIIAEGLVTTRYFSVEVKITVGKWDLEHEMIFSRIILGSVSKWE